MSSDGVGRPVLVRLATLPLEDLEGLATSRSALAAQRLLARQKWLGRVAEGLCEQLYQLVPTVEATAPRRALLDLKRHLHRNQTPPPPALVEQVCVVLPKELRDDLALYARRWRRLEADRGRALARFEAELAEAREHLRRYVRGDFFRELLFLVKRDVYEALPAYLDPPLDRLGRRERRTETSALRYLARAAAKTVPLRLLGASGLARVGAGRRTTLRLGPTPLRRRISPNRYALDRLLGAWSDEPDLAEHLTPYVNPSLFRVDERLVFRRESPSQAEGWERCELAATPLVEAFIAQAGPRRHHPERLVEAVHHALGPEVRIERCWGTYLRLVDEGLLLARLELPFNPPDALAEARRRLGRLPAELVGSRLLALQRLEALIARVQAPDLPWPERRAAYMAVEDLLGEEAPATTFDRDELLVVDAVQEVRGLLGRPVVEALEGALGCYLQLVDLARAALGERWPRRALSAAFREQFGAGRRVPLWQAAEALDQLLDPPRRTPADGDGEGGNGVAPDRELFRTWPAATGADSAYARWITWLHGRVERAAAAGESRIALARTELEHLGLPAGPPPEPLDVVFNVAADSRAALERGDFLLTLEMLAAPGLLSARFAYLFGGTHGEGPPSMASPLAEQQRALVRAWQARHPDRVAAEVACVPVVPRAMNVARRPEYTGYEIELARPPSERPREQVLSADDLFVELSPATGELELWSARLNRQVEPTYHTALNPSFSSAVALLARIATLTSARRPVFDRFPDEGSTLGHVPRITLDRLVLWRERWNFGPDECPVAVADDWTFFAAVQRWRLTHGLPRWVFAASDKEPKPLPVDLDSPLLLRNLAHLLDGAGRLVLEEMLPSPAQLWLKAGGRRRASEFLVTLFLPEPRRRSASAPGRRVESRPPHTGP